MKNCLVKRRLYSSCTDNISMVYKVVMLLRSRKEISMVCTSTSLVLRITILCKMALDGCIELDENNFVILKKEPSNAIEKEFMYRISEKKMPINKLLKNLNGEYKKRESITHLRAKVYADMEMKKLIKFKNGSIFNNIIVENMDLWHDIFLKLVEDVNNNAIEIETEIILMGLDYVNKMQEVLMQCNEKSSENLIKAIKAIKEKIKNRKYPQEKKLIYKLLEEYLN